MRIEKVLIENYRNIDGLEVQLQRDISFIVGENNIGKSNLIMALSHIFSGKSFAKSDFKNENSPIKCTFTLFLNDDDIGVFDDLIDPESENSITIVATQTTPDDYIVYIHLETEEIIHPNVIKKINLVCYDSLRNPRNEIDFNKAKGAGAFLNKVLHEYITSNVDEPLLDSTKVDSMILELNDTFSKLNAFSRFDIIASVEDNQESFLSRIVSLKDSNNVSISETGYGVQFSILIVLSLLEKIEDYAKKKKEYEKVFSTVLVFDEPEIHLHPFLQKTILSELMDIATGNDANFNSIIKKYFGIESIEAQIIVATHSPNMIMDDYKKIVRLYKDSTKKIHAASGFDIAFSQQDEKTLLRQFEYVKEAVYARVCVIVEGDSEYACMKQFGKSLGISFDSNGISVIKAGGAESVIPIMNLLERIGIYTVGIIDRDKKDEKQLPDKENLFYTTTKCFDSEIVTTLFSSNHLEILNDIIEKWDSQKLTRPFTKNKINKIIKEFNISYPEVNQDYSIETATDLDLKQIIYLTWFAVNKGIIVGKIIGETVPKEHIPCCYIDAINKAKEYSE